MNIEILALLDECLTRGVSLALQGDRLRVRGEAAALTPALRESLRVHRAALVELLGGQGDQTRSDPVHRPQEGDRTLSSAQHRLWFVTQLAPASSVAYNIIAAVRVAGGLDVEVLTGVLAEVVRRHDTFRTAFVTVHGEPRQRISATATIPLNQIALADDQAAIDELLVREGRTPFDLQRAPLVRGVLARVGDRDHVFALILHHLISDGWSSGIIINEVATLYSAYSTQRPSPLPELPLQYTDYVEWQREGLTGPSYEADVRFWKRTLDGLPTLTLPTDHPRPPRPSFAGTSERFKLPRELTGRLESLGRREGATLFMTLLAGFAALLSRYTGQYDVGVGTTVANRPRRVLEPLIGFFTNMVAMRTDLSGNPSFATIVGRVRDTAHLVFAHQELPFDRVVEALQPERMASHNPLVQVCFSLLQAHRNLLHLPGMDVALLDPLSPGARLDLTLTMEDTHEGLVGAFEYSSDLFDRDTIVRLIAHFQTLLEGAAADPDQTLADLPLLSDAERHRILVEWNDSRTPYPRDATVHHLVEEHAARTPEALAVRAEDATLTYEELNGRANRLARRLRARGVGPDTAVAVAGLRSADMVVALLAVLKAGGYYVPFDPADPSDRLAFVFAQVRPALIVVPDSERSRLEHHGLEILSAASVLQGPSQEDEDSGDESANLEIAVSPDNLAYTTYTSGSTGVPKGICIPHRGVVRLVRDTSYMTYDASLVFLEIAPVSFDASTLEVWGALASGALLVVLPPGVPSLREVGDAIERHAITALYLTSALFNVMVDERVEVFAGVRHLMVGGDIISVPHARRVLEANPGVTLINGYGPTETTVFASCGVMTAPGQVGYTVTIGRPIANTTLYVLDERFNPTPVGVPGNLFIAGDGNGRGYLNLPGLTAESFVPNPFGSAGDRMYRTGDLARYLADGALEFLGRKDHQVKIRGFRIELGEIENVLTAIDGVAEAVVLVNEVRPGDKRLVAYVQPRAGHQLTDAGCTAALRDQLPDYMVPSAFVYVDAMPLTPHNKIDRVELRKLTSLAEARPRVAPATMLEQAIAHIWQDVLEVESVGVTESFFDLGGHSLLATQVMWRVFEVFGIELPLRQLFDAHTVADFAAALERAEGGSGRLARVAALYEEVRTMSADEVTQRLAAPDR